MAIETFLIGSMVAVFITIFVLYIYLIYLISIQSSIKGIKKKFFVAMISVLNNAENEDSCIKQLNLNFKKLSESYSNFSSELKSSLDLLEEMIFEIDTLGEIKFEKRYGIKVTNDIRNKIIRIIENMREQNPFVSISSKEANLLRSLNHAIESGNEDLGHTILKQLSEEIGTLESIISIQDKRNNKSYIIAIVGVILTSFFGIFALIN